MTFHSSSSFFMNENGGVACWESSPSGFSSAWVLPPRPGRRPGSSRFSPRRFRQLNSRISSRKHPKQTDSSI